MIFRPVLDSSTDQSSSTGGLAASPGKPHISLPSSGARTPVSKPASSGTGHRTPKRTGAGPTRLRPVLPSKNDPAFRSAPNLAGLLGVKGTPGHLRRRPSLEMDLVSDIGDNRAIGGGYVGALPASFAAQLAEGLGGSRHSKAQKEEQERFTKIMMARMSSLEEGFREVIHEMRDHMRQDDVRGSGRGGVARPVVREKKIKGKERHQSSSMGGDKENVDPESDRGAVHDAASTEFPQGRSVGDVDEREQDPQPAVGEAKEPPRVD